MPKKAQLPETQFAAIYARYSSHSQNDASIEQQVEECEKYAKMNNLQVVKVYADRHLTGTNDKRPEFQRMPRDSEKGHWQYVITWKVDCFARNRYDSATYKYRLKKHGVKVLYAKEAIPDGPEGILLESVLEGVDATLRYVLQPDVIQWIADAVMAYQEREGASAELSMLQEQKAENEKSTANLMKAIEMGIITENTKRRLLALEHEAVELKRSIDLEIASHTPGTRTNRLLDEAVPGWRPKESRFPPEGH